MGYIGEAAVGVGKTRVGSTPVDVGALRRSELSVGRESDGVADIIVCFDASWLLVVLTLGVSTCETLVVRYSGEGALTSRTRMIHRIAHGYCFTARLS